MVGEYSVNGIGGSSLSSAPNSGVCMYRRDALFAALERLEQATVNATNEADRNCFTIATILCAYGASEALLHEWAKTHAPTAYEEIAGSNSSLLRAAEEVLPQVGDCLTEDLIELVNIKNALCDPTPAPTPIRGEWQHSAQRAAAAARALCAQCFPEASAP